MKEWYKQLPDHHPAMQIAIEALGWEGKGIMDRLACLLQEAGDFHLTESMLRRNFGFNSRKASRVLKLIAGGFEKLREYFAKDCKTLKSFAKDSETLECFEKDLNVSQSFAKLDPQNPHGSTRDQEEKRREEREEKKEKPAPKKISEEDIETAKFILEKVKLVAPSTKTPNLDKWADSVRLMIQEDHHTHAEIKAMMTWANQDSFWSSNILSPATLREKWPRLEAKQNSPSAQPAKPTGSQIPANRILLAHERTGGSGKL
jgi:hypothetical protein